MIHPLNKNIVVELIEVETKTTSGIILEGNDEVTMKGKILASGVDTIPKGVVVVFIPSAAIKVENEYIINSEAILGVFLEE